MKYFPLLFVLPPEIIQLIHIIILKQEKVDKIIKTYRDSKYKQKILSEVILSILHNGSIYNHRLKLIILPESLTNLEFLVNNDIPKIYNRNFWLHLLSEMSFILMHMHNTICMKHKDNYSSNYYINLKKGIFLWFKLCQRFNIQLRVYYRNIKGRSIEQPNYIWTRYLKKIDNFHKFLHTPLVIGNNNVPVSFDRELSKTVITSFLN